MVKNFLTQHALRIGTGALVFLSLMYLPWWVAALLAIFALFRFHNYYEIFFFAFIADSLFGKPLSLLWGYNIGFFVSAFMLFMLALFLKRFLASPW